MTRAADDAVRHAGEDASLVTVSSGASPSGRVHLGNLREFLTVHFVAEELRRRGVPTRHLHVWDDYDRFRKVPVGVDESWSEHIGRPLSKVPDPEGCHPSWAEHFKQPLHDALHAMGVDMDEVSQTERYEAGHYKRRGADGGRRARRDRGRPGPAPHQVRDPRAGERAGGRRARRARSSSDEDDEPVGTGDLARFPYKPYCRDCGRDTVTLTAYDDETTVLAYTCELQRLLRHARTSPPSSRASWSGRSTGRCAGPSSTSTSSRPGWTTRRPARRSPSGTRSWRTSSGCRGRRGSATGSWASPACRRCRRRPAAPRPPRTRCRSSRRRSCAGSTCAATRARPSTSTSGPRWSGCTTSGTRSAARLSTPLVGTRRCSPSSGRPPPTPPVVFPRPSVVVPFRLLSSVADVTAGNAELISQIVSNVGHPHSSVADLEPRLSRAMTWTRDFVPDVRPHHRPHRARPRAAVVADRGRAPLAGPAARPAPRRAGPRRRPPRWSTAYPSWLVASASTTSRPTRSRPTRRRSSGCSTTCWSTPTAGPRLPTLFVALGADRVRSLLTPPPA